MKKEKVGNYCKKRVDLSVITITQYISWAYKGLR